MLLTISLLAPLLGPLVLARLGASERVAAAVDGFVLVAIGGLVCLHALPESVEALGWPALVAALAGLALPKLLHAPHAAGCSDAGRVNWVGALAALALVAHAVADGVGLVRAPAAGELHAHLNEHVHVHAHHHGGGPQAWLPWAVALHRAVEGCGLWWLMRAQPIWRRWGALVGLGCATATGHAAGAWAAGHGLGPAVALLQASVAGSLAHVLLWHAPVVPAGGASAVEAGPRQAASAVGGLMAATLLGALALSEHGTLPSFAAVVHALSEAPAARRVAAVGACALCALSAAALLHAREHARRPLQLGRGGRFREAVAGALAGLMQTSCSCGVWPLAEEQRRRGASPTYALAFVAAAPAMGLVAAALSLCLLGPTLTLLRALGVAVLAVGAGLAAPSATRWGGLAPIADAVPAGHDTDGCGGCGRDASTAARLSDGVAFAAGEVLEFTAPWLFAGLACAWVLEDALAPELLPALAGGLQVGVLALLGAPLYLCAAASTLLASSLLGKGASAGAVLAFLWSSSSLSPALLAAWRAREAPASTLRFVSVVLVGAVAGGTAVDALAPKLVVYAAAGCAPGAATLLGLTAACGLGLRALWRSGVRGSAAQLARPNRTGSASHHHAHS